MRLIDGDKLEKHLDYLIQKDEQLAKECSQSPNNEFERQRRYCFEANALAYGLCKNVMNYYLVADVQPVKCGKWEQLVSTRSGFHYEVGARCSCCNEYVVTVCTCEAMPFEFCPHCTADMRGDAELREGV